jgi:hypothetical protein
VWAIILTLTVVYQRRKTERQKMREAWSKAGEQKGEERSEGDRQ